MKEQDIQSSIKKKLKKQGWTVLKIIQLSDNGYPDLLCLKQGQVKWIEVKRPGEKPSELQLHRINQLKKEGFDAVWVSSADEI